VAAASLLAYTLEESAVSAAAYAALYLMFHEVEPDTQTVAAWMAERFAADGGVGAGHLLLELAPEETRVGSVVARALALAVAAQAAVSEDEVVAALDEASGHHLAAREWMLHISALP
jgi:thioredoxin-like negative regulator of GroEL